MEKTTALFGRIYDKGEVIFHQGDPGDEMFIVQSGAVEVSVRRRKQKEVLTLLEKGDFFGEIALLGDNKRSATVTAIARTRLLSVSRRTFLQKTAENQSVMLHVLETLSRRIARVSRQLRRLIDSDPALRERALAAGESAATDIDAATLSRDASAGPGQPFGLSRDIPRSVFSSMPQNTIPPTERHPGLVLPRGWVIFEQGDVGDRMYHIVQGTVEIYQAGREGSYRLALLGPGDFFGEMALITGDPRTAGARTLSPVRLRSLNREEMLHEIQSYPDTGLFLLQVLIQRLRDITRALERPESDLHTLRQSVAARLKKSERITMGISSLSSCGGCAALFVRRAGELDEIADAVEFRYCPMLMDQEEIREVQIAVVDGAVRSREDEEKLYEVRRKSRYLVAWGTCAAFGGLPVLANHYELEDLLRESYGQTVDPFGYYMNGGGSTGSSSIVELENHLLRKARKVSDVVKVDFFLPGCPPIQWLLKELLQELTGSPATRAAGSIVCAECDRKPNKEGADTVRLFPAAGQSKETCFLSGGTLCLGFLSRGGCLAVCPAGGLPCWACRGPSNKVLSKMTEGESFEEVALRALARRLKKDAADIRKPLRILRLKGGSGLGFQQHFIMDVSRIR